MYVISCCCLAFGEVDRRATCRVHSFTWLPAREPEALQPIRLPESHRKLPDLDGIQDRVESWSSSSEEQGTGWTRSEKALLVQYIVRQGFVSVWPKARAVASFLVKNRALRD